MATTQTHSPVHGGYPGTVQRDCFVCRGKGELPVAGTYGPTVSPEALELVECYRCHGEGAVSA